ncbi:MAG: hypothetical protein ACRYG2_37575 [Janthinobacterium lividum]
MLPVLDADLDRGRTAGEELLDPVGEARGDRVLVVGPEIAPAPSAAAASRWSSDDGRVGSVTGGG